MLLICRLKFQLLSKWIPKSSIDGTDLIVWVSIVNGMFLRLDYFLPRIMAGNLSELIIISFFVNQSMAILLSDAAVAAAADDDDDNELFLWYVWLTKGI